MCPFPPACTIQSQSKCVPRLDSNRRGLGGGDKKLAGWGEVLVGLRVRGWKVGRVRSWQAGDVASYFIIHKQLRACEGSVVNIKCTININAAGSYHNQGETRLWSN